MQLKSALREIFFILIIVLSILDAFEFLSSEINFVKKMLSWILIGYLLHYISITRILFNHRHKKLDLLILIAFYLYAFKDFSHVIINEEAASLSFMKDFLLEHKILNEVMFSVGSILTLFIAIYLGFTISHKENSILGTFRKPKERKSLSDKVLDSFIIYIIFLFFLYFIFAVVMEWFALALDSLVIIVALSYYFTVYYILRTKRSTLHSTYRSLVHSVVQTGDRVIELYLELFHSKDTILFALSGLIVISPFIDVGNFIIPLVLNMKNAFYLSALDPNTHQTIFALIKSDLASSPGLIVSFSNIFIYLQNTIFIALILSVPFLIWLKIFSKRDIQFNRLLMAVFFSGLIVFFMKPVYNLSALVHEPITGVDITTKMVGQVGTVVVSLLSVIWFFITLALSKLPWIKVKLEQVVTLISVAFLGSYIYKFFFSTALYYIDSIKYVYIERKYFLVFYLVLYLLIVSLFYISGFILFLSELLVSEHISYLRFSIAYKRILLALWIILLTLGFLYLINLQDYLNLAAMLTASTILSLSLYRHDKEEPSAFILSIILVAFSAVGLVNLLNLDAALAELILRFALMVFAFCCLMVFGFRISFDLSLTRLIGAIVIGLAFGVWFNIIQEPKPPMLSTSIFYILLFCLIVSLTEEFFFRFMLFRSLSLTFPYGLSILLQAVVFGLLHFMNLYWLSYYLGDIYLLVLLISLVVYGTMMALLVGRRLNPWYAVLSHWITLVVSFVSVPYL